MCTHYWILDSVEPGKAYPAKCSYCLSERTFPSLREQQDTMEQGIAMGGRFDMERTKESIKRGQFKKGHNGH